MKNQKLIKKSFQDSDPLPEEWRNNVEKKILTHMKQLSVDNLYILLSYAHELLSAQLLESCRNERIQDGKKILKFGISRYIPTGME